MTETVGSLARLVGGTVHGDADLVVKGVGDLRFSGPDCIGFLRDVRLADAARTTRIGALLVDELIETRAVQVLVGEVDVAFARIAQRFHPTLVATEHRVHPTATVGEGAFLEEPVEVGPNVVVGRGVRIGAGTRLGAGVVVGDECRVGRECVLHPRVVLYAGVSLGARVIVHAGAVVGSDGFGYAREPSGAWVKWPQLGTVTVEDDVEIGANVTIDRAALGATRIGRGTKIDNLVHIGHNCSLGEHVAIAGFSALAGSVKIGDRVQLGGHTVCAGHLELVSDVRIGGGSVIASAVREPGDYMGYPLVHKSKWIRLLRALSQLPDLVSDLRGGRGTNRRPPRDNRTRPGSREA